MTRRRRRVLLTLSAALVVIPGTLQVTNDSRAAPAQITVFPIPGSRVAMPEAQITFRGLPIGQLGTISVTGSLSGVHAGRLVSDSDGQGGSFIPSSTFTPGETVTVRTVLSVVGGTGGTFSFTIAHTAGAIPLGRRPPTPRVRGDVQLFHSQHGLIPPAVRVTNHGHPDRGYIFIAPLAGRVQSGPMIVDANGRLIWFSPLPPGVGATDMRPQTYDGRSVLTWWQGNVNRAGIGQGHGVIDDTTYRTIDTVNAANGYHADLHEFQLTRQNTALIGAYRPVFWNASGVKGGSAHTLVLDAVVQEIDIPTGLVQFQWDSLDHIPLGDSYRGLPRVHGHPYDYFHLNSIQEDSRGNLIVSSRDTWAGYKIDHRTGAVLWILGGKRSGFKMVGRAQFAYQHDLRVHGKDDSTVTLFDDGGGPPRVHRQSRALTLHLDFRHRKATVTKQDFHRPPVVSDFEGNDQLLAGGHSMVGWGQAPYFTEFDSRGRIVTDGQFVGPDGSYRAYKFRWTGRPAAPPAVAASGGRKTATVWASWNGSTAIRKWRILGGSEPTTLHTVKVAGIRGFETAIQIRAQRYVEAQALDGKGHLLGSSSTVRVG